jgi:transposase-like protein
MTEQIIDLFKNGLGDKEIAKIVGLNYYAVGQEIKRLGLVRTKEQLDAIKKRCQKNNRSKYKPTKKLPKDLKNYITDNIRKGLINSTTESLETDIEIAVQSINKIRNAHRKNIEPNVSGEEREEDIALPVL